MAVFNYKKSRVMDPRPGVKYSTTYYQQSRSQAQATYEHVKNVAESIVEVCEGNPDWHDFVQEPLSGYPRSDQRPNYSVEDVVSDLLFQLDSGRDIPSGMLGRWNRLFADTEWDIELVQEYTTTTVSPGLFANLFGGQ